MNPDEPGSTDEQSTGPNFSKPPEWMRKQLEERLNAMGMLPLPHVNGSCSNCKQRFRFNSFELCSALPYTIHCPHCNHDFGRESTVEISAAASAGVVSYFDLQGHSTLGVLEVAIERSPRILLKATKPAINDLSVFISHHSADRTWAEDIGLRLRRFGFQVVMVPPIGNPVDRSLTDRQVGELLSQRVLESDFLIVLLSPTSVLRDWVREEVRLAARTKGRALYISRTNVGVRTPELPVPDVGYFNEENPLWLKHVTIVDPVDERRTHSIATALISDPDEGCLIRPIWPLAAEQRPIRQELRLKQRIRGYLLKHPKYESRQVINVYPCFWKRMGVREGDAIEAREWLIGHYGSFDLLRVGRDYSMNIFKLTVASDRVLQENYQEGPLLSALVVWRPWHNQR